MTETYRTPDSDQSLGDLAGQLTSEVGALFSDHLQLARVEMTEDLRKAGKGAGMMGGAAVSGWIAALLLSMALAWGLAELVKTWLAFLIVGVLWAIAAAVMAIRGRRQLDQTDLRPEATIDEIARDKEWIGGRRT
ncbi:MAG TPA: phage holin family protein [Acidimicrobiia bacterium]